MKILRLLFATIVAVAAVASYAERPPDWAVGDWRGYNGYTDVNLELRITRNGDVTFTKIPARGRCEIQAGQFRDGHLNMRNEMLRLERNRDKIRVIDVNNSKNWAELSRIGGNVGSGGGNIGGGGGSAPDWSIGNWSGFNGYTKEDLELRIDRNGVAVLRSTPRGGRAKIETGLVRDETLTVSGTEYKINRRGSQLRLVNASNSRNWADLKSGGNISPNVGGNIGGTASGSVEVPSWLVGTWQGYNGFTDMDVVLSVDRAGKAVMTTTKRGNQQKKTWQGGWGRDGLGVMGALYEVERRGGGVRLENRRNSKDWMDLRRQ